MGRSSPWWVGPGQVDMIELAQCDWHMGMLASEMSRLWNRADERARQVKGLAVKSHNPSLIPGTRMAGRKQLTLKAVLFFTLLS